MILDERTAIVADIGQSDWEATQIKSTLDAASAWSRRLGSEAEAAEALGLLVDRVELREDGLRLSIKLPVGPSEKLSGHGPTHLTVLRKNSATLMQRAP